MFSPWKEYLNLQRKSMEAGINPLTPAFSI